MLGWKKNTSEPDVNSVTPESVTSPTQPGKKGRPTPKRRESEAARRRPLVPDDRQAAKKANREEARKARMTQREAMARGDEKALPARDRGPIKRFIRNTVDSRLSIGEILLPLMLIVLVLMFIRVQAVVFFAMILVWGIVIAGILDAVLMWRRTKKAIIEKFGEEPPRGSASYAVMRSFQMRISRMPKPQVKRGDKSWKA
ncbi:DUF3043 domain-containing protein [Demetria terragena]|uniref:DUF3043 domain-containing protein n=1 Tax=Demetria terragena TaxID=63959 RepID=UPI001FDEAAD9|nr:DUF3043 domain-containing protein [Demetria terragena]